MPAGLATYTEGRIYEESHLRDEVYFTGRVVIIGVVECVGPIEGFRAIDLEGTRAAINATIDVDTRKAPGDGGITIVKIELDATVDIKFSMDALEVRGARPGGGPAGSWRWYNL